MRWLADVRRIIHLAAPPPWAGAVIVSSALLAAALEAAGLALFMPLMQALGAGGPQNRVGAALDRWLAPEPHAVRALVVVAALCLCIIGKNLVSFVGGYAARWVDGAVAHGLRIRIFEQTLSACVDYRPGARITDIVTTLANNTWKVSSALSLVYRLLICACTFGVFMALLLAISTPLTVIAAASLGAAAAVVHLTTARAQQAGKAVVEENKAFGLRMWESMNALQLIRSFGREGHETERFRATSEAIRRRMLKLDMMWAIPGPVSEIFGVLLIGLLLLVGARMGVGLASLAAFLAVLYRLQGPTREFMQCRVALEGLQASVDDVDHFLASTREPHISSGSLIHGPLQGAIEFREVSFRYDVDEPLALDSVSFSIPAGQTTALVGRSGSGKSTLMALLMRFYDPASGTILVDGRALTGLNLAAWRSSLSLMAQEAQLFHDSAAANIGYGDLNASRAEVEAAASVAGADAFLRALPEGYDTALGDRGARLSGGQKQRVALARTILKDPQLLLLDEPTNALDAETEQAFQAALKQFSAGKTVVVIAHRLGTVMNADQVVVLEGGKVVDIGPPQTLLRRPGQFARLHDLHFAQPDPREVA
jgi:subfamily B ATP-binding cassette protein MsbA